MSKVEHRYKRLFSTKAGSPIYKLYFRGRYFALLDPREKLYSKEQILQKLGINYESLPAGQKRMVDYYWNQSMHRYRNRALEMGQPWGTLRVTHQSGDQVWLHGYTFDPAKQEVMLEQKHWGAVAHYRAERRQREAFEATQPKHSPQIDFPMRDKTSFVLDPVGHDRN